MFIYVKKQLGNKISLNLTNLITIRCHQRPPLSLMEDNRLKGQISSHIKILPKPKEQSTDYREWLWFTFFRTKKCPRYILLENVKGFEVSESRNRLTSTLLQRNYQYQVCLYIEIHVWSFTLQLSIDHKIAGLNIDTIYWQDSWIRKQFP